MELKQIKELMRAMSLTGVSSLFLKKDGFELKLERENSAALKHSDSALDALEDFPHRQEMATRANIALSKGKDLSSSLAASESASSEIEDPASVYITSPMVGTFYASPSPEDPFFAKKGDYIEKGSVVCIIEAMKVMNEIKSSASGTVAEMLVESGDPVEFGTKLFRIT